MAVKLVIVESPAKARTIERFLDKDYKVLASQGHIRDLPKSKLGVDVDHNFDATYEISKAKTKIVNSLKKEVKAADEIILATDEDREGEAIAWHLLEAIKVKATDTKRVVFHEVTKEAILQALANPRQLDMQRVDSQQARRILDRLVGYKLSPFLWFKIRPGLSAGRVQSVAVRLIVEREREREAFEAVEYWSVKGDFKTVVKQKTFQAALHEVDGEKVEISNQTQAEELVAQLKECSYEVESVQTKDRKRKPYAPFTTSTLQQEAARKFGYSAKKTMLIAQQLYEGIDLGQEDRTGLITYMRTDSLHLANSAVDQARKVIEQEYGKKYMPAKPVVYKTKSKGAQEAHEAIRPTFLQKKPEELESALSPEQFKLYELIYKRTLACQMAAAVFGQTTVVIGGQNEQAKQVKEAKFRVTGSVLKFPGFLAVYDETREEDSQSEDEDGKIFLPPLQAEEKLDLTKLLPEQHFTQPPARYSEATLVKALEEHGIGRPSTYAPIIGTIRDRGYVRMEKKRFVPEDVGMVVNDLLVEHFPEIVDIDFTASLEEKLDQIASGQKKWVPVIADFYKPFSELLEIKTKEVKKRDVTVEETDETCDLCGKPMLIRLGKYGKFMACSGYPECKNTRQIVKAGQEESESEIPPEQERSEACEQCGGKMILKKGRYGQFWGCGNYPECKNIQPLHKAKEIGVQCPDCGAEIVVKRTRRGKIFYGCSGYPKCKYASWTKPGE